jgi:hypothetical protein
VRLRDRLEDGKKGQILPVVLFQDYRRSKQGQFIAIVLENATVFVRNKSILSEHTVPSVITSQHEIKGIKISQRGPIWLEERSFYYARSDRL